MPPLTDAQPKAPMPPASRAAEYYTGGRGPN